MATAGEGDVEYESDPEEAKQSLVMRRRRAASDDEDSEGEGEGEEAERERKGLDQAMRINHSDESDGQGGAADYDDEEEEEEYLDEEDEDAYYQERELIHDGQVHRQDHGNGVVRDGVDEESKAAIVGVSEITAEEFADTLQEGQVNQEGEKKPNEPYAVPTAGAFYMHDDRFRDNDRGGRHRRTFGGRRLWESKDERKWGHDKFEEMSTHEKHYDERRRNTRGRGRGRNRGVDRGYGRGNRSFSSDNNSSAGALTNNNSNQAPVPRAVRGRGPRRYDYSLRKSNQGPPVQQKLSINSGDNPRYDNQARKYPATSSVESDFAPAKKNAFGSSLNSASPPFYPSLSSNKEGGLSQKQTGNPNRNNRPPSMDGNFSAPPSNSVLRGNNVANSIGMDKLNIIDDLVTSFGGKSLSSLPVSSSGPSPIGSSQPTHRRTQGRGAAAAIGQMGYQSGFHHGQANRASSPLQAHIGQRGSAPNRVQPSAQLLVQRPASASQASSPTKADTSMNSYDIGESETLSEPNQSKDALITKEKGNMQGSGRGSFIYGGAQVIAASSGDQNFPATPAFLPVMQFGGQHPGGMGVPAVGMAFPGYVAQPQLGLGNSEMAWLPVLAGAAGALGASYCPPYISVDGSYHTPASGQTTAAGTTSKESNANKPNNESKPPLGTESVNEEQGQRQNKARRYSAMNFGQ